MPKKGGRKKSEWVSDWKEGGFAGNAKTNNKAKNVMWWEAIVQAMKEGIDEADQLADRLAENTRYQHPEGNMGPAGYGANRILVRDWRCALSWHYTADVLIPRFSIETKPTRQLWFRFICKMPASSRQRTKRRSSN